MLRIRVVSILPEMLGVGGVSRQAVRDDPSSPIFSVLYLIDQALTVFAGEETNGWIFETKTGMRSDFRPHLRMLDSESNREPLGL